MPEQILHTETYVNLASRVNRVERRIINTCQQPGGRLPTSAFTQDLGNFVLIIPNTRESRPAAKARSETVRSARTTALGPSIASHSSRLRHHRSRGASRPPSSRRLYRSQPFALAS